MGALDDRVAARLKTIERDDVVGRIWRRDHTLWKPDPTEIADRLGWLTVAQTMRARAAGLNAFADEVVADGITHVVLCGMGGSSLAPEVLARTTSPRRLDLTVLDTTHPATIANLDRTLDLERALFVIASKSGGTVETASQMSHFWERVGRGDRFVAITDPGSPLEREASDLGFRAVFANPPDIGGRYSAMSLFGLVPAALLGSDLEALLDDAEEMARMCGPSVAAADNPGASLGAAIGEAALAGRDKLTLLHPDELTGLGDWVEQLVAESTGKEGLGILPVTGEQIGAPGLYGDDRLFVATGEHDDARALAEAGQPVLHLAARGLGAEFFRWEFAVAVAGHVLGIHPFDQPNVAEAKDATKAILEGGGADDPGFDDLVPLLAQVKPRDYVALLAFLDPSAPGVADSLRRARTSIRDRFRVATTVGFGPRYLHSTGQLHKGGPDTGVFVQVVDRERALDVPIPGAPYTFGRLIDAQALGDLRSLRARGRRVARVTLEQLEEATR